jgi:hypothetical protein
LRNPASQLGDAYIGRIPRHAPLNGLHTRLRRGSRRVEVRLTHAEIEHVLSRRLPALCLIADGDGFRRFQVLNIDRQGVGHAAIQ